MKASKDPMGMAIADYQHTGRHKRLTVLSPMFDDDEFPVATLFRTFSEMPPLEQTALRMAKGRILDAGAAAGCHTLALQDMGHDVTAIDISPLSVATMRERGVKNAAEADFFQLQGQYDTILLLMNGAGMAGTLERMPRLFAALDRLLAPGGQVLADSSDLIYLYEDEDGDYDLTGVEGYYGEVVYQMKYGSTLGDEFPWLYIDSDTLEQTARECGYCVEVVERGTHFDYLARLTRK